MSDPILALDSDRVSKLTGIPKSTLTYWENKGVFRASYVDPQRRVPFRRIYSFRDVVSLRALAQIRRDARVSFEEILQASKYLSEFYDSPWSQLRFGLVGGKLVFRDPDTGKWAGVSGQQVLELNVEGIPEEIKQGLPAALARDTSQHGLIARNRYVLHNKPVIAGTRIPTSSIWNLHESGFSDSRILEEFPQLDMDDVRAALVFEQEQRNAA